MEKNKQLVIKILRNKRYSVGNERGLPHFVGHVLAHWN